MKRFVIGAVLLISLLLSGILATGILSRNYDPMEDHLRAASQAALEENWPQALNLARQAHRQWQNCWTFTAVFSDHEPMEQIDALFARLRVYAQAKQAAAYSALCAQLAQELSDLGEDHIFTWWNFL